MEYNENFWLAMTTVAPVIFLASLIPFTDSILLRTILPWLRGERIKKGDPIIWAYTINGFATATQIYIIYVSLSSLAFESNNQPPSLMLYLEMGATLAFICGSILIFIIRSIRNYYEMDE